MCAWILPNAGVAGRIIDVALRAERLVGRAFVGGDDAAYRPWRRVDCTALCWHECMDLDQVCRGADRCCLGGRPCCRRRSVIRYGTLIWACRADLALYFDHILSISLVRRPLCR